MQTINFPVFSTILVFLMCRNQLDFLRPFFSFWSHVKVIWVLEILTTHTHQAKIPSPRPISKPVRTLLPVTHNSFAQMDLELFWSKAHTKNQLFPLCRGENKENPFFAFSRMCGFLSVGPPRFSFSNLAKLNYLPSFFYQTSSWFFRKISTTLRKVTVFRFYEIATVFPVFLLGLCFFIPSPPQPKPPPPPPPPPPQLTGGGGGGQKRKYLLVLVLAFDSYMPPPTTTMARLNVIEEQHLSLKKHSKVSE